MSSNDRLIITVVSLLLVLTLAAWFFAATVQEEGFSVTFLDVGQGDATLFSFGGDEYMLVDCGRDRSVLQSLGRSLPFYQRSVDILAVTHPDADHFGGCIDVLKRFEVGQIILSSLQGDDAQWDEFIALAKSPTVIKKPTQMQLGNAFISFLYPDTDIAASSTVMSNNKSLVLRVNDDFSVLLTGDAEQQLEEYLVATYGSQLNSDVLQVGHHGSNTSSIEPFVQLVSPEISIVSAGQDNKYGHPTPRVLSRLKRVSSTIMRTDKHGDIVCASLDMHTVSCVGDNNLVY